MGLFKNPREATATPSGSNPGGYIDDDEYERGLLELAERIETPVVAEPEKDLGKFETDAWIDSWKHSMMYFRTDSKPVRTLAIDTSKIIFVEYDEGPVKHSETNTVFGNKIRIRVVDSNLTYWGVRFRQDTGSDDLTFGEDEISFGNFMKQLAH